MPVVGGKSAPGIPPEDRAAVQHQGVERDEGPQVLEKAASKGDGHRSRSCLFKRPDRVPIPCISQKPKGSRGHRYLEGMAEKAIWQRDLPSPEVTVEGQILKFIYMTFVLEYFIFN